MPTKILCGAWCRLENPWWRAAASPLLSFMVEISHLSYRRAGKKHVPSIYCFYATRNTCGIILVGFQILYGAGVTWKDCNRLETQPHHSAQFANADCQQLLLIFKNGCFKLIMMLTRCNLNELFHFITSIPKSLLEIRTTIKHSGYQTFIMHLVNSPTLVLRKTSSSISKN